MSADGGRLTEAWSLSDRSANNDDGDNVFFGRRVTLGLHSF